MTKVRIEFVGQKRGAIGVRYPITETIEVPHDRAEQIAATSGTDLHDVPEFAPLWDKYDHVFFGGRKPVIVEGGAK